MDIALTIATMVVLLLLQGFFSGSEIALVHADRLKLHHLARQGHRGATLVLKLFRRPEVLLGTTLVGTNISVVSLTTLGTILMMDLCGEYGDIFAFLLYTPILLVFGEVVPKSVYQQKSDQLAPVVVFPLQFFSWLFYPVVFVFSWSARMIARLAGVKLTSMELFVNREQIRSVVEMAEWGANIDVFDRDRIIRVVNFADSTVGQVMIPIVEMTTLNSEKTTRDAIRLARQRAHFRLPVYEGEHNRIIGAVSFTMWDLMNPTLRDQPLSELVSDVHYVTALQRLDELLPVLQQRHDHLAIVVDEFGSAIGMVTLEDVLKEVAGEVMDVGYTFEGYLPRHRYSIEKLAGGGYLMDGRVPVTEASAVLGVAFPPVDAHTIGGMVIAHLRHIPAEGEYVILAGYCFTVEQATDWGIGKLRIENSG